jgi:hypothetical protein
MPRFVAAPLHLILLVAAVGSANLDGAWADPGVLVASDQRQWYRGNMHTHSHWSDGDDYLDMIALWYRARGYQFLVFTDHNVLADTERWIDVDQSAGGREAFDKLKARFPEDVDERTSTSGRLEVRLSTFHEVASRMNQPGRFLLIQGEEISDRFEELPIHLNVSNIQELIPPMTGRSVHETIQNNVRAAIQQRKRTGEPMVVHLNHPNFGYAVTAEDLMLIRGDRFFEVYNGHPRVFNAGDDVHASTDRIWDILLTRRLAEFHLPIMYGLAVDDSHNYHQSAKHHSNPGRGWVMVLAKELSVEALVDALERGDFYATSGVMLRRIEQSADELTVEVESVEGETYLIEFIGTRRGYDSSSQPVLDKDGKEVRTTRRYSSDVGAVLATVPGTKGTYRFAGDEIYVRARVTSSAPLENPPVEGEPQRAWCQPVVGAAGIAEPAAE